MKNFKQHDIVMIATDKKSKLWLEPLSNSLHLSDKEDINHKAARNHYLYIISDDIIKNNSWTVGYGEIKQADDKMLEYLNSSNDKEIKKIIATTDSSLTEYTNREVNGFSGDVPLPQIPQSFVEYYIAEYNKRNIITKVMIEYERLNVSYEWVNDTTGTIPEYKLLINSDNSINIKPIKNIWNKEEVKQLILKYALDKHSIIISPSLNSWIEQNL
jgi:hypothetical protein